MKFMKITSPQNIIILQYTVDIIASCIEQFLPFLFQNAELRHFSCCPSKEIPQGRSIYNDITWPTSSEVI